MSERSSLTVDPNGHLIVTTHTDDAIYITKLDSQGRLLWHQGFSRNGPAPALCVPARDSVPPDLTNNEAALKPAPRLARIMSGFALGSMVALGLTAIVAPSAAELRQRPEQAQLGLNEAISRSAARALADAAEQLRQAARADGATLNATIIAWPKHARIFIDGTPLNGNPVTVVVERDHQAHEILIEAEGYAPRMRTMRFDNDLTLELPLRKLASTPHRNNTAEVVIGSASAPTVGTRPTVPKPPTISKPVVKRRPAPRPRPTAQTMPDAERSALSAPRPIDTVNPYTSMQ